MQASAAIATPIVRPGAHGFVYRDDIVDGKIQGRDAEVKEYRTVSTTLMFHQDPAQIRCIVGPVGSGKTSAAAMEIMFYLPHFLYRKYGIKHTRWVVVRNTYSELMDTTLKTVFEWLPGGTFKKQAMEYHLKYGDVTVEVLFRSCDRPDDVKKFKSLEVTGYWIDESIEVDERIKRMLKNRIGRYPQKCPVKFGVETTNPPDVEHPTYYQFRWMTPVPGPVPEKMYLQNHHGFWQPERENAHNLGPRYYEDLIEAYRDSPDWIAMYVQGKPGVIIKGKQVYANFKSSIHVAKKTLLWAKGELFRGWDNSGNTPAACVVQMVPGTATGLQVLREWTEERRGIVDFTRRVVADCNVLYPGARFIDYGDPAGENKYSKADGGFTSNKTLQQEECGVNVMASEQNLRARIEAVDQALGRIGGLLLDPSVTRLINGFVGGYCYQEVGKNSGIYSEQPEKNRFSHVHDSLQYVLVKILKTRSGSGLAGWTPRR